MKTSRAQREAQRAYLERCANWIVRGMEQAREKVPAPLTPEQVDDVEAAALAAVLVAMLAPEGTPLPEQRQRDVMARAVAFAREKMGAAAPLETVGIE